MEGTLTSAEEKLRRIHIALHQAGSVAGAAGLLGMDKKDLKKVVNQDPALKSYLPGATIPNQVETIARQPLPVVNQERDLVAAVKKADEQVREGFTAIGVTGDALTQAIAFADFGRMHCATIRHYASGGVAKLFADLMADIKEVRDEIKECDNPDREKILREDRSRLVGAVINVYDRVRESSLTTATIEAKKAEAREGKNKGKKSAAFPPLAVTGDVHIHEAPKG